MPESPAPCLEAAIIRRLRPDQRVLDIGCNNGLLMVFLAQSADARMTGLDISDQSFLQARQMARKAKVGRRVSCVKGDAHRMSFFKSGTFDAVIIVDSLHHLEQPHEAVAEVHRVLKPGGLIIVAEVERQPEEPASGCLRFTRDELTSLMLDAEFHDLEFEFAEPQHLLAVGTRSRPYREGT